MRKKFLLPLIMIAGVSVAVAQDNQRNFVGGLSDNDSAQSEARPVRNDVPQPADEVLTLRYFKIKKGTFPEFLKASQEGVWPYFEKIGSRVVGMWQVIHPDLSTDPDTADYDEVYLLTRYASVEHWAATRDPVALGGNGPDWDACRSALELRRSLTLETRLQFLKGSTWQNPPAFMPGLNQ